VSSPDEAWQLANYVTSLQLKTNWKPEIVARKISGPLPTNLNDPLWQTTPHTEVNLQADSYEDGHRHRTSVNAVSVQAVSDGKQIAFRLFWNDPTMNEKSPADALLIAFPPKNFQGKGIQNLHNEYAADGLPLNLNFWSANDPTSVHQSDAKLSSALQPGYRFANKASATAHYDDGLWSLLMVTSTEDIGQPMRIGFSAWDGTNGEAGLKRSSSQWIMIDLNGGEQHGSHKAT